MFGNGDPVLLKMHENMEPLWNKYKLIKHFHTTDVWSQGKVMRDDVFHSLFPWRIQCLLICLICISGLWEFFMRVSFIDGFTSSLWAVGEDIIYWMKKNTFLTSISSLFSLKTNTVIHLPQKKIAEYFRNYFFRSRQVFSQHKGCRQVLSLSRTHSVCLFESLSVSQAVHLIRAVLYFIAAVKLSWYFLPSVLAHY